MPGLDPVHLEAAPGGALSPGNPADDAMLRLLAHMVVSDGVVHQGELGFLSRLLPGKSLPELEMWAREKGAGALDVEAIARALVDPDLQWKCLRFAARMAWKDGSVAEDEKQLMEQQAGRQVAVGAEELDGALDVGRLGLLRHFLLHS